MSRALITSDVHIDDYRNHNILGNPRFRLEQFQILAERIREVAEDNNCEHVFIAGDLINRSSPRPYVAHAAYRFLKEISESASVFLVAGQHDLDTRTLQASTNEISHESTYLSIFEGLPNVRYVHREILKFGRAQVGFSNWEPKLDLSWISEKADGGTVDVMIGHETIDGSKLSSGHIQSGSMPDARYFKIGFFGDIHRHQVLLGGKIIIPGVPIQNNRGDHSDNGLIICDLESREWERVPTHKNRKFLVFLSERQEDKLNDEYYVQPLQTAKRSMKTVVHKSLDILHVLQKVTSELGVADIHAEIFSLIKNEAVQDVDCNFVIEELNVTNFRSIESLCYRPGEGILLFQGSSGSGKSTLVSAIKFCLVDFPISREHCRIGTDEMSVSIQLKYGGNTHFIEKSVRVRKSSTVRYEINGKEIESDSIAATREHIFSNLPFLAFFDIFFYNQTRSGFLSSYSYKDRIALLSKVLNLRIIELLERKCKDFIDEFASKTQKLVTEKTRLEAFLSVNGVIDFSCSAVDYDAAMVATSKELDAVKKLEQALKGLEKSTSLMDQYTSIIAANQSLSAPNMEALERDAKMYRSMYKQANEQIKIKRTETNKIQENRQMIVSTVATREEAVRNCDKKLENLREEKCFTCGSTLNGNALSSLRENLEEEKLKLKRTIETMSDSLSTGVFDTQELEQRVVELEEARESASNGVSQTDALIKSANQIYKTLERVEESRKHLADEQDRNKHSAQQVQEAKIAVGNLDPDLESVSLHIERLQGRLGSLKAERENQKKLEKLEEQVDNARRTVDELDVALENERQKFERYQVYAESVSAKGVVISSVLQELSSILSTPEVRVRSQKQLASGEFRIDFDVDFLVRGQWINYDACSEGQKTLVDITILSNLLGMLGPIGMLVFDETLKYLSDDAVEYATQIISSISCNQIYIITQAQNFPNVDRRAIARLQEDGTSAYSFY